MTGLLSILLLLHGTDLPIREHHNDCIEINHVYHSNGTYSFSQIIGWDWVNTSRTSGDHHAQWWLYSHRGRPAIRRCERGGYEVWHDAGGRMTRIVAPYFRETWTQATKKSPRSRQSKKCTTQ